MNIKKLRELKKNKKGFTLIEIIVVIVILAVLMAVAVPSVLSYLDEANNGKYEAQARAVMTSAQAETVKELVTVDGIESADKLSALKTTIGTKCGITGATVTELYKTAGDVTGEGTDGITYSGEALAAGDTSATVKDIVAVKATVEDGMEVIDVLNEKVYLGKAN